jgi:hypothetical protein
MRLIDRAIGAVYSANGVWTDQISGISIAQLLVEYACPGAAITAKARTVLIRKRVGALAGLY